jgi:dipeptidase E
VSGPHIVAFGGGGFSDIERSPIDEFVFELTGTGRPRVCFLATATGDDARYVVRFYERLSRRVEASHLSLFGTPLPDLRERLEGQDVVYVGGGSTASMLGVWRVHGMDLMLREAWEHGTVLCGVSAGATCWFEAGLTDSVGPELGALTEGLGLLAGSFCPHLDSEPGRRAALHRLLRASALPGGYALEDGVALHFAGSELVDTVSERPGASAFRVDLVEGGRVVETPIAARQLERSGDADTDSSEGEMRDR